MGGLYKAFNLLEFSLKFEEFGSKFKEISSFFFKWKIPGFEKQQHLEFFEEICKEFESIVSRICSGVSFANFSQGARWKWNHPHGDGDTGG